MEAVACLDSYLAVVPEIPEDFLISWSARGPRGEFERGLFVDVCRVFE